MARNILPVRPVVLVVRLRLPMPVSRLEAHPYVAEDAGRVALLRGPILYGVEGADNPDLDPRDLVLPDGGRVSAEFLPGLLGGVVALEVEAEVERPGGGWENRLYRDVRERGKGRRAVPARVRAIPYHAWANREAGPMRVRLRTR